MMDTRRLAACLAWCTGRGGGSEKTALKLRHCSGKAVVVDIGWVVPTSTYSLSVRIGPEFNKPMLKLRHCSQKPVMVEMREVSAISA